MIKTSTIIIVFLFPLSGFTNTVFDSTCELAVIRERGLVGMIADTLKARPSINYKQVKVLRELGYKPYILSESLFLRKGLILALVRKCKTNTMVSLEETKSIERCRYETILKEKHSDGSIVDLSRKFSFYFFSDLLGRFDFDYNNRRITSRECFFGDCGETYKVFSALPINFPRCCKVPM